MTPTYDMLRTWIARFELSPGATDFVTVTVIVVAAALLGFVGHRLARMLISRFVSDLVEKTHTLLDDYLVEERVFDRLALFVPGILLYLALPAAIFESGGARELVERLLIIYMLAVGWVVASAILNAIDRTWQQMPEGDVRPIKSYLQMIKLLLFGAVTIIAIATLIGKSPWLLLSGLGAMTAVLLLVFKDVLLGLVASVQIASHDMVRIGDWIEMPKYTVDGAVTDITLTTVKVRNWDNTLSLVPAYALISDAFKNWRNMTELGGRRIKRSIPFDATSVEFCTEAMLERFREVTLLRPYLDKKLEEIREYNAAHDVTHDETVNGRRLTNLGTFRAYAQRYLEAHPAIRDDMTLLVRQLAPGPTGIPIEIYAFSGETNWAAYEGIQGDIFDHLLAVAPQFGLRVLQQPTGYDVRSLAAGALPEAS